MKIKFNNKEYDVSDEIGLKSPYLKTLCETTVKTEKDDNNFFVLEYEPDINFESYIKFLKDEYQVFDNDMLDFLDYMGHDTYKELKNEPEYRSTFLSDELVFVKEIDKTQYCHTINIDISSCKTYIAGGYALYLYDGESIRWSDVDIFFTEKESLKKFFKTNRNELYYNCKNYELSDNYIQFDEYQLILKLFSSPYDIVKSFDIGACQFIFDGRNLYATHRALYEVKNKRIYFNRRLASTMYINRLIKYREKGFKICLPEFDEKNINHDEIMSETIKQYLILHKYEDFSNYPKIMNDQDGYITEEVKILFRAFNLEFNDKDKNRRDSINRIKSFTCLDFRLSREEFHKKYIDKIIGLRDYLLKETLVDENILVNLFYYFSQVKGNTYNDFVRIIFFMEPWLQLNISSISQNIMAKLLISILYDTGYNIEGSYYHDPDIKEENIEFKQISENIESDKIDFRSEFNKWGESLQFESYKEAYESSLLYVCKDLTCPDE